MTAEQAVRSLRATLAAGGDPTFAAALQRYFPDRVEALGVSNADVVDLASAYLADHPVAPEVRLEMTELLLQQALHHEEVLLGFALLHKVVKRNFDLGLLDRCRSWLENVVSNWAQCDDLCLKLIFPFFLGHPELITATQGWLDSPSLWARRAGNVSVLKLVRRRIGRELYELPLPLIFGNSLRLINDPEPYVQKSVGWLLKVTAQVHPGEVTEFLHEHGPDLQRETLRTATEKLDPDLRQELLAVSHPSAGPAAASRSARTHAPTSSAQRPSWVVWASKGRPFAEIHGTARHHHRGGAFMATISVEGRQAEVEDGKRLVLAIEEDLGIDILHKCGGNAMCTTCRVQFEVGEPSRMTEAERTRLTERELLGQARLSCQIACEGEMVITPLMTVSSSGTDSPGPQPADEISPEPRWTDL